MDLLMMTTKHAYDLYKLSDKVVDFSMNNIIWELLAVIFISILMDILSDIEYGYEIAVSLMITTCLFFLLTAIVTPIDNHDYNMNYQAYEYTKNVRQVKHLKQIYHKLPAKKPHYLSNSLKKDSDNNYKVITKPEAQKEFHHDQHALHIQKENHDNKSTMVHMHWWNWL